MITWIDYALCLAFAVLVLGLDGTRFAPGLLVAIGLGGLPGMLLHAAVDIASGWMAYVVLRERAPAVPAV
jgi:hypothetical protein